MRMANRKLADSLRRWNRNYFVGKIGGARDVQRDLMHSLLPARKGRFITTFQGE